MRLFARSRQALKWTAPAVALAWVGWIGLFDRRAFEPGPVSTAHAMFGHDCARCHVESMPESLTAFAAGVAFSPVPDKACVVCHDGLAHHAPLRNHAGAKCVDCHREHRDQHQLARVTEKQCTICHADLNLTTRAAHNFTSSIDSWTAHPEFAVLRPTAGVDAPGPEHGVHRVAEESGGRWQDRARIKLNHAVHIGPRGVLQLDGTRRRLECNACHLPDRASGYMLPINQEQHCASCHGNQLLVDQTLVPGKRVPHVDAAQVRGALREFFAGHVAGNRQQPSKTGQQPEPVLPTMRVSPDEEDWINARVNDANRVLFEQKGTGCRYCHTDVDLVGGQWHVAPAGIPARWLTQSVFRHDSHRMLICIACHQKVEQSRETSDILLPGIETCRRCHQQPALFRLTASGAARAECAECHLYHQHHSENFDGLLGLDLQVVRPEKVRHAPGTSDREKSLDITP